MRSNNPKSYRFLGPMHARLLLLGLTFTPAVLSTTTSAPVQTFNHSEDDEYEDMLVEFSDIERTSTTPATTTEAPSPFSVYRRWLYHILGISVTTEAPSDSAFEETLTHFDEWILINRITRDDPVFTDMWDPLTTGDWTALSNNRLPPPGPASTVEDESKAEHATHVLTDPVGLFRWSYSTVVQDDGDREIERMSVWKRQISELYNESLPSFLVSVVSPIDDSIVEAIRLDVDRTQPIYLRPRMTRVLMAYAYRNPAVGFCQGMSYIVSALVQQSWMSDEEVFMALSVLIENINQNYYDSSLSGVRADLRRLEILLIQKLTWIPPIPLVLVLVEPVVCLFTRVISIDSSLRILDIAFAQNRVGLLALYLALLDVSAPAIQRAQSGLRFEEIMSSVNAAVTFREELIRITSDRDSLSLLLKRAEEILTSYRPFILELLEQSELPDDIQWVVSTTSSSTRRPAVRSTTTTTSPPRKKFEDFMQSAKRKASGMMASLRKGLDELLDEDEDSE
jgi:hypothetical protein